ncbi:hypothetical protein VP01_269g8 [Puccinia sorghi]|uniref:Peroxin-19 n=1 Tax=Puccinia sorghi TaxID=27349 RepID=A0A0L6V3N9_9BASI|nr:hypothetical protein VP01_269g8 [Puccinia sorghi]
MSWKRTLDTSPRVHSHEELIGRMSADETLKKTAVAIEDDMEEDFDDLLEKFQAPSTCGISSAAEVKKQKEELGRRTEKSSERVDFARDLAEGMEALLAGMKQEDGGQFQKHLEALVDADGGLKGATDLLDALNQNHNHPSSSSAHPTHPSSQNESQNFQAAIQETMEKLKQSDHSAKATNSPSVVGEEDEKLSALFEKMMGGENGLPDENQLQTILQSFMEELMSKEIMYEPLKDMNRLFPDWIKENRSNLSPEDLQRYETQSEIIQQVLQKFEDPNWDTEEKAGGDKFAANQKQVIDLLTKMQDCGPPPKEILGDMPAGVFGEDGLPNPEQCVIS